MSAIDGPSGTDAGVRQDRRPFDWTDRMPGPDMNASLYTDTYKDAPYWWDEAPRPAFERHAPLPAQTDVLVIGSGFTGLTAAIETARAGRSTLVVDASDAGWGCSSRNGGQVATSIKPTLHKLSAKYGPELGYEMRREGHRALDYIESFIKQEGLKVNWERVGRFHGAHNPRQYEKLGHGLGEGPKDLRTDAYLVPRAEQHKEIGSDRYYG